MSAGAVAAGEKKDTACTTRVAAGKLVSIFYPDDPVDCPVIDLLMSQQVKEMALDIPDLAYVRYAGHLC
ncbi:MAG TPA: hypothetical protein VJ698_15995 [Noviherbaspirillum sp.]|uniref:hypothetical protein n=1 Tax=Noviherbaspirillum sp. TaxID=1926288 RepID=UPI002B4A4AB3|nr:hypothetical protein [Noviherbaspirillum sp.]HJV86968.1 hypothetical protein [Noviherbaspirillum sp.]